MKGCPLTTPKWESWSETFMVTVDLHLFNPHLLTLPNINRWTSAPPGVHCEIRSCHVMSAFPTSRGVSVSVCPSKGCRKGCPTSYHLPIIHAIGHVRRMDQKGNRLSIQHQTSPLRLQTFVPRPVTGSMDGFRSFVPLIRSMVVPLRRREGLFAK